MIKGKGKKEVVFALFGATGDLAIKKIFPALDRLSRDPESEFSLRVIGVSRRNWESSGLVRFLRDSGAALSTSFEVKIEYAKVDIDAGSGYAELKALLERSGDAAETVIYLSLAPQLYEKAFESLVRSGIVSRGRGRILIEKPFGTDEKTARRLDELVLSKIDERQLYRVDHYLGKETVMAMMDLHESTPDFGRMISSDSVSSIRVRLLESRGIDGRGASYDGVGAFRDVGQNHMLEMLAIVTADMAPGRSWQEARADAIELLSPPANTCELSRRGQYEDYLSEKGVKPGSLTETAFEVVTSHTKGKLKGVPLVLESGKKMPAGEASLEISFKDISGLPKRMVFSIQPEQRIDIEYHGGQTDSYQIPKKRDAYENVLLAALRGSEREFVGREEIEALWRYADRVVACWDKVPLERYSPENPFRLGPFAK